MLLASLWMPLLDPADAQESLAPEAWKQHVAALRESMKPIPALSAVPEMEELTEFDAELAVVKRTQSGKSLEV